MPTLWGAVSWLSKAISWGPVPVKVSEVVTKAML